MISIGGILERLFSVERVSIYDDESFKQIFDSASPMRISVREDATITRFPVENGEEKSDHMVIEPVEIVIDFLLTEDTKTEYQALRETFLGKKLVTVQTKVASYPSMLIEAMPHEESPQIGTAIFVPIRFAEWRPVTPETSDAVADPKQSKTTPRGQQQTTPTPPATKAKGSIAYDWFGG